MNQLSLPDESPKVFRDDNPDDPVGVNMPDVFHAFPPSPLWRFL
jgi:hypothetical protein